MFPLEGKGNMSLGNLNKIPVLSDVMPLVRLKKLKKLTADVTLRKIDITARLFGEQ